MRTLNELISEDVPHSKAFQKIVECSKCGSKTIMAGYIHDYTCQNCVNREDFNVQKLPTATGQEHQHWRRKYTSDQTIPAVPDRRDVKSEKQDDR